MALLIIVMAIVAVTMAVRTVVTAIAGVATAFGKGREGYSNSILNIALVPSLGM